MHPHRRRKKRHNYGIRTVEVERGPNGFGFTISGQQPCILSCIVCNSPADQAGLRAGDFLISVNGLSVSKSTHDAVVKLIGSSFGPIKMSIAEYYYSDSSDEELDMGRMVSSRKPKYAHKPRPRHHKLELPGGALLPRDHSPKKTVKLEFKKLERERERYMSVENCARLVAPTASEDVSAVYDSRLYIENRACSTNGLSEQENVNTMAYSALVGYLGTIEMPNALQPSTRLQTVCSCIRKLRQEKRSPTAVLMTVLPACLTLKNANNQLLAIYPANRVTYISSSTDKESRYFGLVTSAISENRDNYRYMWEQPKPEKAPEVDISNSCHVFVTDPKLVDHKIHVKRAENFNITCTSDIITGNCLEFPKNALYVVSLVQNMYRLQNCGYEQKNYNIINEELLLANSPQPSASSNSDSGIGFRDDCGNISDRILVVEFPPNAPRPVHNFPIHVSIPHRPHAIDGSLENLENYPGNNHAKKLLKKDYESPKKDIIRDPDMDNFVKPKDVCDRRKYTRMSTRILTESSLNVSQNSVELSSDEHCRTADVDTGQIFTERPIDVPDKYFSTEDTITDFKSSVDNISVHSFRSCDLSTIRCGPVRGKKQASCEELREEIDGSIAEARGVYGSLQELAGSGWTAPRRTAALSEPDVRIEHSTLDLMNVSCLFISTS